MYKLKAFGYVFFGIVASGAVGYTFYTTWGLWGILLSLPVALVLGEWSGRKTVVLRIAEFWRQSGTVFKD